MNPRQTWSIEALKEHFENQMNDHADRAIERYNTQLREIVTAQAAMDKRLDSINEFREQLRDQEMTYLTKAEYQSAHKYLMERVETLGHRADKSDGRAAGIMVAISAIAAIMTILVALSQLR